MMATVIPFDQLAPMLRVIPSLSRPVLARLTERLLERLDEIDGDNDVELNGDETDHCGTMEDEFYDHPRDNHANPGCPLSDPGGGDVGDEWEERDGMFLPVYGADQSTGPVDYQPPR